MIGRLDPHLDSCSGRYASIETAKRFVWRSYKPLWAMTPSIHLDYDAVKEVVCTIWIARANYGKRELRPRERYENSALNPAHGTHASGVLFDDLWYTPASGLLLAARSRARRR